jgi:hypothetical protein
MSQTWSGASGKSGQHFGFHADVDRSVGTAPGRDLAADAINQGRLGVREHLNPNDPLTRRLTREKPLKQVQPSVAWPVGCNVCFGASSAEQLSQPGA